MRSRLDRLLGPAARGLWILTFHAACGRILRREAPQLGYRSNFTIYDQADQVRLVKLVLEELERDPKRFVPRGIHAQISKAKNQLIGPEEYRSRVASFYDQTVADAYELYQRRLFGSNAVDFDDLLMLTVDVLERFPEVARALAERLPLRPRGRVPGHQPRPVPAAAAARRRAPKCLWPSETRTSRSTPSEVRTSATSSTSSATSPRRRRSRSSRTTARPTPSSNRRTTSSRTTASASRRTSGRSSGRGSRCSVIEVEDEHAEARFVAAQIAQLVETGPRGERDRGLLPDERAVPGAGGHARPPAGALPGDRRHRSSTSGRRSRI